MTPFLRFSIRLGPYFMSYHNLIDPSFCRKIGLSLSHLVPGIVKPKNGLNVHQHVLLISFKHSVYIFCLIFDPNDPTFQ